MDSNGSFHVNFANFIDDLPAAPFQPTGSLVCTRNVLTSRGVVFLLLGLPAILIALNYLSFLIYSWQPLSSRAFSAIIITVSVLGWEVQPVL